MTHRVVCRSWSLVYPPKSFFRRNTLMEAGTTSFSICHESCYSRAIRNVNLLPTIVANGWGRYQQLAPYSTKATCNTLDLFLNICFGETLSPLYRSLSQSGEFCAFFCSPRFVTPRCRKSLPEPCAQQGLLQACYSGATASFGEVV